MKFLRLRSSERGGDGKATLPSFAEKSADVEIGEASLLTVSPPERTPPESDIDRESELMFQNRTYGEKEPNVNNGAPTVIRAGLHLDGNVKTPNDVLLEGSITGEVTANAITVAEGATLCGVVSAAVIVVYGSIEGVVRCVKLQVNTTGAVRGEIHHSVLVVEAGAVIEGTILRTDGKVQQRADEVEVVFLPPASEDTTGFEAREQLSIVKS